MKNHLSFEPATPDMQEFMLNVARTIGQQPDCTGAGGHGPREHGGHGPHWQLDVGLPGTTIDIRFPLK